MVVYDPLYGRFSVPAYLHDIAIAPAVRRLSQIRLVNTPSPSIATLGEIRRYSHTLGVLRLALNNPLKGFSEVERRAFGATVLLHDVGTPPFAHLVEYHLKEREPGGWNHESMIDSVLKSKEAPENRAHQIFVGRTNDIRDVLAKNNVSFETVESIVNRKHPLSSLLFGTLDIDNLDNVARMAWGLGIPFDPRIALRLAAAISVGPDGAIRLQEASAKQLIREWAAVRRQVYEILLFDPQAVAAQAILSKAVGLAMEEGVLSGVEWDITDEQLLGSLLGNRTTKDIISREFLGILPAPVFCVQIQGTLADLRMSGRNQIIALLEDILTKHFHRERVLGYVITDRGTFEKKLLFKEPDTDAVWEVGQSSGSVILYGFVRLRNRVAPSTCRDAATELIQTLGIEDRRITRCVIGIASEDHDAQRTFDFPSA